MAVDYGPTLSLWHTSPEEWTVSVLVGIRSGSPPKIDLAGSKSTMVKLVSRGGLTFYRHQAVVPISESEQSVQYKITGAKLHSFQVPAKGALPRFAYASCNGFHSTRTREKYGNQAAAMWESMLKAHRAPYHALILGGDQIYADLRIDAFLDDQVDWGWFTSNKKKRATRLSPSQLKQLTDLFTGLYVNTWQRHNPAMMEMLATCPTMMMWDDHDIIDGWGSLIDGRESWPVYQAIYERAREAFMLFQLHCKPTETPAGVITSGTDLTYGHHCQGTAVLHLDTRSSRTRNQIMTAANWRRVNRWIKQIPETTKHLFVCVSSPLIYADFDWVERLLLTIPGDQQLEDDLRDQWRSKPHKSTRLKLLETLFECQTTKGCRVTLVSGDVHVAAHGIIETRNGSNDNTRTNRIHQLISSPIVNQPGNRIMDLYLRHQGETQEDISPAISGHMARLDYHKDHHAKSFHYLSERNWLSLIPNAENTYRAEWHFEGADYPCKKEIHRC